MEFGDLGEEIDPARTRPIRVVKAGTVLVAGLLVILSAYFFGRRMIVGLPPTKELSDFYWFVTLSAMPGLLFGTVYVVAEDPRESMPSLSAALLALILDATPFVLAVALLTDALTEFLLYWVPLFVALLLAMFCTFCCGPSPDTEKDEGSG